jgi:hypothetical protein
VVPSGTIPGAIFGDGSDRGGIADPVNGMTIRSGMLQ